MNIAIKNLGAHVLDALNVDIIKSLTGEFSADEANSQLINFYYNKAIIDITAIKEYLDINKTLLFLKEFEPNKIVIFLNDSDIVNSNSFLGKLVENGYYNFTRNAAGINYLLTNPNSHENVKKYTEVQNLTTLNPTFNLENFENNNNQDNVKKIEGQIIIGVQNLTDHAGATTLTYMLAKQLKYNYSVKAIEFNKQDFVYFRNDLLTFCTSKEELKQKLKSFSKEEVILIDLNNLDGKEFCDEILYLVEPGIIKINKLIKKDSNAFQKTKDGKIILNRSSIKDEEIADFEYETKLKVFFNMNNFNERRDRIQKIDLLLYNLGFKKQKSGKSWKK